MRPEPFDIGHELAGEFWLREPDVVGILFGQAMYESGQDACPGTLRQLVSAN
jgi:hypothetical protein